MKEIYYGLWANMLSLKVYQRAMIVLLIVLILVKIILFLAAKFLGWLLEKHNNKIIGIIYKIWQSLFVRRRNSEEQTEYIQRVNQMTLKFDEISEKLKQVGDKLNKGTGIKMKYFIILYFVCILLVSLPDILKNVIDEQYAGTFSFAQSIYCSWESDKIQKAMDYNPLIHISEDEGDLEQMNEPEVDEDGVWLQLTEEGINGTNIRVGPSAEDDVIDVLSGDVQVKYLDEENEWVYVEMQNGIRGWVKKNLLERVEE